MAAAEAGEDQLSLIRARSADKIANAEEISYLQAMGRRRAAAESAEEAIGRSRLSSFQKNLRTMRNDLSNFDYMYQRTMRRVAFASAAGTGILAGGAAIAVGGGLVKFAETEAELSRTLGVIAADRFSETLQLTKDMSKANEAYASTVDDVKDS